MYYNNNYTIILVTIITPTMFTLIILIPNFTTVSWGRGPSSIGRYYGQDLAQRGTESANQREFLHRFPVLHLQSGDQRTEDSCRGEICE